MSSTAKTSLDYLKTGWGIALSVLYVLLLVAVVVCKFTFPITGMMYAFILSLVATIVATIAAFTSPLPGDTPDPQRARGRFLAVHTLIWLTLSVVPYQNATGWAIFTLLMVLLYIFAGMAWRNAEESESSTTKTFKKIEQKVGNALPVLFIIVFVIGWFISYHVGSFFSSAVDSTPGLFAKFKGWATEENALFVQQGERIKNKRFFQEGNVPPAPGMNTNPSEMIMIDPETGQATTVTTGGSSPAPRNVEQPAPTAQSATMSRMKVSIAQIRRPLSFLNGQEVDTWADGFIDPERSGSHAYAVVYGSSAGGNLIIENGVYNGSVITGSWKQEQGPSGTYELTFTGGGSVQVTLRSNNTIVGVMTLTNA